MHLTFKGHDSAEFCEAKQAKLDKWKMSDKNVSQEDGHVLVK